MMAVDKLVDSTQLDTDLTSVANAIRAKSGGSGQLAFPAGFVSEIGNIPSGGGGGIDNYSVQTVEFTLASSTPLDTIMDAYVKECGQWAIYPSSQSDTSTNTIATGTVWPQTKTVGSTTTPTGVSLSFVYQYYVNDQSYRTIRTRGNVSNKPAGSYILKFNGIAK